MISGKYVSQQSLANRDFPFLYTRFGYRAQALKVISWNMYSYYRNAGFFWNLAPITNMVSQNPSEVSFSGHTLKRW